MLPITPNKGNSLIDLTPPTSPWTIPSKTFSIAARSRSIRSRSASSSSSPGSFETFSSVESCQTVSIEFADKRLHYTLKVKCSSGNEKIVDLCYNQFYKLDSKLLSLQTENIQISNILLPFADANVIFQDGIQAIQTISEFNSKYWATYRHNIPFIIFATEGTSKDMVYSWNFRNAKISTDDDKDLF